MNQAVQLLAGAASVAVIAAAGLFFWNDHQRRLEEDRQNEVAQALSLQSSAVDCLPEVTSYDQGDKAPARKRYGEYAEEAIKACRHTIDRARELGLIPE